LKVFRGLQPKNRRSDFFGCTTSCPAGYNRFQKLGNDSTRYATVRAGEKFHQALSDHARIWQTAEILPRVDKLENYIVNAEIGIEADLTKDKNWPFAATSPIRSTTGRLRAAGRMM